MRSIIPATFLLAAALASGCAATVASDGYGPDLVTVSPGVQVIADYDEPIFYSDGYYWRYYGGGWYRSSYYTGGWAYARPPVAVMRIDRPYAYAHYHPSGWRGHPRTAGAPVYAAPRSAPAAAWRGPPPAAARRAPVYTAPRPAALPPSRIVPQSARPAPAPGHGAPPHSHGGGGWRGR
jgi:hypothetical protein